MMKKIFLTLSIGLLITSLNAQIQIKTDDQFISTRAYNQKITQDLNYLILGENSPQQGISAVLNGTKSNLKISGLLYTGSKGILTVEADLAASNGVYFFDQENGSEQGKITLNLFKPLSIWTEQYPLQGYSKANIKLQTLELIKKAKKEYFEARCQAINSLGDTSLFEDLDKDVAIKELKLISEKYINKDDAQGYHKISPESEQTYCIVQNKIDSTASPEVVIKNFKLKDGKTKQYEDLNVPSAKKNSNISKVLKAYENKRKFILEKLEDSINDLELKSVKSKWASTSILFLGISPFYERQSFKRFLYDENLAFSEMFNLERGNVYGLSMSLNYNLSKEEGSRNPFKPQNLFLRAGLTLTRASNISSFRNSTLDLVTPVGNDVNGNPVTFTNTDNAFIGDTEYEYGFGTALSFEAYYYPFRIPIGCFGIIGYQNISFNRTSEIDDKELYPMRLGLLFNLANKAKGKPIITIQAFVDRTDLNLSPNGEDQDLRFGLGLGFPINLRKR